MLLALQRCVSSCVRLFSRKITFRGPTNVFSCPFSFFDQGTTRLVGKRVHMDPLDLLGTKTQVQITDQWESATVISVTDTGLKLTKKCKKHVFLIHK